MSELQAVQEALQTEANDKAINDAKMRAVKQRVDYETFKKMVSTAHLRPLQAPTLNRAELREMPAWAFGPNGKRIPLAEKTLEGGVGPTAVAPESSAAFKRDWRRACHSPAQRWAYLQLCCIEGPQGLQSIFRTEIDGQLLAEILEAIDSTWPSVHTRSAGSAAASHGAAAASAVTQTQLAAEDDATAEEIPPAMAPNLEQTTARWTAGTQHEAQQSVGTMAENSQPKDTSDSNGGGGQQGNNSLQHAAQVEGMLHVLTKTGRFALAKQLMGSKGQQAAASLFRRLQQQREVYGSAKSAHSAEHARLQSAYGIQ